MAPYNALTEKFAAEFEFYPFFRIEPLTSKEFRAQHVNIADYTAVVFSSRAAIDAYFKLAEEFRFKVPETMKYFCSTELVANYLQKHIVYRKRKIFFGTGTPESIVALIGPRHTGEKFLIAAVDSAGATAITSLFEKAKLDFTAANLVKSVFRDLKGLDLHSFDMMVLYNKADVESLFASYPDFKQGDLKIMSFGKGVVKALSDAGLKIAIQAPTPEAPSVVGALEIYLSNNAL